MKKINISAPLKLLGSVEFLVFIIFIFVMESTYLAATSRFPMAFDESYHFGLIIFFSHHISPIVNSQDSSTYKFGALVQGSSLLYHYLMSFPYRLIELFSKSYEVQVVILRFINVVMAVFTLIISWKLLRIIKVSKPLSNLIILVLAFTPLFMLLSAQINYDNLLITLSTYTVYQMVIFLKELDLKKFNSLRLIALLSLCLGTSLVMYSFLPFFVAVGLIVTYKIIKFTKTNPGLAKISILNIFSKRNKIKSTLLVFCLLLTGFLFTRIYIVNIVRYHDPVPECNQILNIQDCKNYYAWDEDYVALQSNKTSIPSYAGIIPIASNTLSYFAHWSLIILVGLYGTILPLRGIYSLSYGFFFLVFMTGTITIVCLIINRKKLYKNYKELNYFSAISLIYIIFLFSRNYHDYLRLGQIIAVSGRYLAPVLIFLYGLLALAAKTQIDRFPGYKSEIKLTMAIIMIIGFIGLGGFWQYNSKISPQYGHLSPSNSFILGNHTSSQ